MTSLKRAPLVTRGTPAAHALRLTQNITSTQAQFARLRRRTEAAYGQPDGGTVLLLQRLEEQVTAAAQTANALQQHLLMYAPAPRDDSEGAWLCANPACSAPMYGRKRTARTCSGACRAELSRLERAGALS